MDVNSLIRYKKFAGIEKLKEMNIHHMPFLVVTANGKEIQQGRFTKGCKSSE
jgi:hypothetical protein